MKAPRTQSPASHLLSSNHGRRYTKVRRSKDCFCLPVLYLTLDCSAHFSDGVGYLIAVHRVAPLEHSGMTQALSPNWSAINVNPTHAEPVPAVLWHGRESRRARNEIPLSGNVISYGVRTAHGFYLGKDDERERFRTAASNCYCIAVKYPCVISLLECQALFSC